MLLSQRIAKDPKFLSKANSFYTTNVFDLRMRIINATKIVVAHEFLNFDDDYGANLEQLLANSSSSSLKEKADLYRIYARLPFLSMFIENDTGAILVEQTSKGFSIHAISNDGGVHPFTANFSGFEEGINIPIPELTWHLKPGYKKLEDIERTARIAALVHTYIAMDVMLFMNVKNVTLHHYVPSKKENSVVPKPLLSKYEYRILDVFHDIVKYVSLDQITTNLTSVASKAIDRRSHLVRGHFKEFKNGLFGNPKLAGLYWWNVFRRSRKNRDTVGEVEKDYRLTQ